jgi:glutathione S-transferase
MPPPQLAREPDVALVIYGDVRSGNCLKVKWTAERLGLAYDWVEVDFVAGQSRTPEFRRLNPAAQVPTVLLEDGRSLAQSNAIILYLARGGDLVPADPYWQAKVQEWLFWEQSSHEPYLGMRLYHRLYLKTPERRIPAELKLEGEAALTRMETWLSGSPFLINGRLSLADIALLPYTRWAPQAGFSLERFPHVQAWVARTEGELGLSPA